jgi:hypothetical protein
VRTARRPVLLVRRAASQNSHTREFAASATTGQGVPTS